MRENDVPLGAARLFRNYSTYTAIVASLLALWQFLGWGWPLVMAKDYERDKSDIYGKLAKIEAAVGALTIGQMEAQELALQARVQDLERELAKTADGPLKTILTRQKNEADQSLAKIRAALAATRTQTR